MIPIHITSLTSQPLTTVSDDTPHDVIMFHKKTQPNTAGISIDFCLETCLSSSALVIFLLLLRLLLSRFRADALMVVAAVGDTLRKWVARLRARMATRTNTNG